eukprot:gene14911-15049_t
MPGLSDATKVIEADGGGLTATLHPNWEIWGPNGGYLSAVALRAAGRIAPEGHRPVTYSCQYLSSPKSGAVELEVETVKPGRSSTCIHVRMQQNGRTALLAQIWTTNRSDGPQKQETPRPDVPGFEALQPLEHYLGPDQQPHTFWRNFEARPVRWRTHGDPASRDAKERIWFRFLDQPPTPDPFDDYGRLLVLIDTLPRPSFHKSLPEPPTYIAPSLDLSVWFHDAPGEGEWLLGDGHGGLAGSGLIHGGARIWSADGRLLASGGSQMLVVDPR